jgi:endonuclease-3
MTRIESIISILKKTYPRAKIVLGYSNPWELLVAVILSAQCTDIMVNKVTEKLFAKYKTLDDYVNADITEFEKDIRSTGFYHNKAKNILASARLVKEKFNGKIPNTMDEILTLPGVARKTANVVLGNAYRVIEGIAVDTHVHRLSQRLRLIDMTKIGGKKKMTFTRPGLGGHQKPGLDVDYVKDADPVRIEKELMNVIPKSQWFVLTYLLINHGRVICKAQNPHCGECVLRTFCPSTRI